MEEEDDEEEDDEEDEEEEEEEEKGTTTAAPSSSSSPSRTTLTVLRYEDEEHRAHRLESSVRRRRASARGCGTVDGVCVLCGEGDGTHGGRVHLCPKFQNLDKGGREEAYRLVRARAPCWRCGRIGHAKRDCPEAAGAGAGAGAGKAGPVSPTALVHPPSIEIEVGGVLGTDDPFRTYCELLAGAVQREEEGEGRRRVRVMDGGLGNGTRHREENWNTARKSILIVASS